MNSEVPTATSILVCESIGFITECRQYNSLDYPKVDYTLPAVVGGTETAPQEFPHMVILAFKRENYA